MNRQSETAPELQPEDNGPEITGGNPGPEDTGPRTPNAAEGAVRPRLRQMVRRRASVRLTGDLQGIPAYPDACVRYLWYVEDVDGQAVDWQGPGYYVRWVLGGTWTILGVDLVQARNQVNDRVRAYKRDLRRQRQAEREPLDPGEVAEAVIEGGTLGVALARLALAILKAFGGGR